MTRLRSLPVDPSVGVVCEVGGTNCATKHVDLHHSPPQSWAAAAGKQWQGRMHELCPNHHSGELHEAIDERIRRGRLVRVYSPKVRALVDETFALAAQYGYTPAPTL